MLADRPLLFNNGITARLLSLGPVPEQFLNSNIKSHQQPVIVNIHKNKNSANPNFLQSADTAGPGLNVSLFDINLIYYYIYLTTV